MPTSNKRFLTRGLLGAVLVFFLMPFVTLTCGGSKLTSMNGITMATGTSVEQKDAFTGRKKNLKIKAEPLAALAALAAVVALGLAFVSAKKKTGSMVASGAAALLLLALKFKVDADVVKQGEGVVAAQWEVGFWLALLASLVAVGLYFVPDQEDEPVSAKAPEPAPAEVSQ